jgi:hypothetical protein
MTCPRMTGTEYFSESQSKVAARVAAMAAD